MLDTHTSIYNISEVEFLIQASIESFKGTFQPTYLLIKQHRVTGKLYFCKTTKYDPIKYLGSGKYWLKHIKKHGKEHVETISSILFVNIEDCVRYAITISLSLNIVGSGEWANLINENGLDGWAKGTTCKQETKDKLSAAQKNREPDTEETRKKKSDSAKNKPPVTEETKANQSAAKLGTTHKQESKDKMSESAKNRPPDTAETKKKKSDSHLGKKQKTGTCPHCGRVMALNTLKRCHLDNCKLKSITK